MHIIRYMGVKYQNKAFQEFWFHLESFYRLQIKFHQISHFPEGKRHNGISKEITRKQRHLEIKYRIKCPVRRMKHASSCG